MSAEQEIESQIASTECPNPLEITAITNSEPDYRQNQGFTSEIFKIEVRNLPKYYGYGEIKKLFNKTLGIDCNKIKIPSKNSQYGFICLKNDEGENYFNEGNNESDSMIPL